MTSKTTKHKPKHDLAIDEALRGILYRLTPDADKEAEREAALHDIEKLFGYEPTGEEG